MIKWAGSSFNSRSPYYKLGHKAAQAGVPQNKNPYTRKTEKHWEWNAGWKDASKEALK